LTTGHQCTWSVGPLSPPLCRLGVQPPVRDLQSWPGYAGPLRRRSDYSLWYQRREPVQRAHDFANDVGGHLGVARRDVELGITRMSMFCSSRWSAKLWRSVCGGTHAERHRKLDPLRCRKILAWSAPSLRRLSSIRLWVTGRTSIACCLQRTEGHCYSHKPHIDRQDFR
jgi:hypothetical protein